MKELNDVTENLGGGRPAGLCRRAMGEAKLTKEEKEAKKAKKLEKAEKKEKKEKKEEEKEEEKEQEGQEAPYNWLTPDRPPLAAFTGNITVFKVIDWGKRCNCRPLGRLLDLLIFVKQ